MPLSDSQLRRLKPKSSRYRISDRDGLYVIVNTNGKIYWRWRYFEDGKDKQLSLGTYPELSLAKAREKVFELRSAKQQGIDPEIILGKKHLVIPTFESVGREWHASKAAKLSPKYAGTLLYRLESKLFPSLGKIPIVDLKPTDVLAVLRPMEAEGKLEIVRRLAEYCNAIADYATILGHLQYNPLARLSKILTPPTSTHYATIVEPEQVGELLRALDQYEGHFSMRMCIKIMPYVFVRSSELRGARWEEIDFETATWTIPAERMKMTRPHIVPLSNQVLNMLQDILVQSDSELCFPSALSNTRCISDVGLLNVLRRLGYSREQMTVHGFRAMASTMLNEQGYRPDVIERQLAHCERNKVRAAYNHAEYLPERREMMQKWADYLDSLKAA